MQVTRVNARHVLNIVVVTSEGVERSAKVALGPLNVGERSCFTGLCCFSYRVFVTVTGQKSTTPRKS